VHLRELATGADTVLVGLPQPMSLSNPVEQDRVELTADHRGRVVAWTANAVRMWENDAPEPVVTLDGYYETPPKLFDDALAVMRGLYQRGAMQFVDLSTPGHHDPTELQHGGSCGGGEVERTTTIDRCGPSRYLVRGRDRMCVWDTVRGKVIASIDDMRDDYSCSGDVVRIGDGASSYAFYSARNGNRLRHHVDETPVAAVLQVVPAVSVAKLPGDVTETKPSPTGRLVAGVQGDRGGVWSTDGRELWKSPAVSEAAGIVLARGQLAVVGRSGEVWHLDLAKRTLTTGVLANCTLPEAPVLGADGRLAAACAANNKRTIMIEGAAQPLYRSGDAGWHVTGATNATASALSYVTGGGIRAWSPPSSAQLWSYDVDLSPEALAISADHALYATAMSFARDAHVVMIRDATNHGRAVVTLIDTPFSMAFSSDGAYLAVAAFTRYGTKIDVVDIKHGGIIDTLYAATSALAWSPDGARFAYWSAGNFGLVIRDVAAKRDIDVRLVAPAPHGPIHQIAWGEGNVIAALADNAVWLWDDAAAPSRILLGGSGAIELRADTTARLLGDRAAARTLYSCWSGARTTPETWCDDKLVDRRPER
jgi:hypothetical protein